MVIFVSFSAGISYTVSSLSDQGKSTFSAKAGSINLGINQSASKSYSLNLGANWYPGMSSTVPLTVYNTGTLPMKYSIVSSNPSTGLPERIDVIAKIGTTVVYQGKLNSLNVSTRTIAANNSEVLSLEMTWPRIDAEILTDFTLKGSTGSTSLIFTATNP